jgi:predicted AAA+ superfamily ATPase
LIGGYGMIERKEYFDKLIGYKDKKIIKVITGIRRCGKSTLLQLFQTHLLKVGIEEKQIVAINFEDSEFDYLKGQNQAVLPLLSLCLPRTLRM